MKFLVDIENIEAIIQEEIPFIKSAEYNVIDTLISKCAKFEVIHDQFGCPGIIIKFEADEDYKDSEQIIFDLLKLHDFMYKEIEKYKINFVISCGNYIRSIPKYSKSLNEWSYSTSCQIFRYMLYKHYNIKV